MSRMRRRRARRSRLANRTAHTSTWRRDGRAFDATDLLLAHQRAGIGGVRAWVWLWATSDERDIHARGRRQGACRVGRQSRPRKVENSCCLFVRRDVWSG